MLSRMGLIYPDLKLVMEQRSCFWVEPGTCQQLQLWAMVQGRGHGCILSSTATLLLLVQWCWGMAQLCKVKSGLRYPVNQQLISGFG
jgi:hypothetical protein